jgi:hypothetical protein
VGVGPDVLHGTGRAVDISMPENPDDASDIVRLGHDDIKQPNGVGEESRGIR